MKIENYQTYYQLVSCQLGYLLVVATTRGLCRVALADTDTELLQLIKNMHPNAIRDSVNKQLSTWCIILRTFSAAECKELSIPVDISGTEFQHQVWDQLLQIPYGETRSYSQIAQAIGRPKAYRAVARACGQNPIALVIPCHRVIHANNGISGYRWGVARKKLLLAQEKRIPANLAAHSNMQDLL